MAVTLNQLISQFLAGSLDRGTFYLKAYELTGSPAALFQAHVSMFSGWLGTAGQNAGQSLSA